MVVRHRKSFILWSVVMLLTTILPVQCDVSCEAGQFYVGRHGNVTCRFSQDVRFLKRNFNIVRYTSSTDESGSYVLVCNWEWKGRLECLVKENYRFEPATTPVTDSLVLEIPTVTESMDGLYACQLVPDDDIPVHTCQLNVEDPPRTAGTANNPLISEQGTGEHNHVANSVLGAVVAILGLFFVVLAVLYCSGRIKFLGLSQRKLLEVHRHGNRGLSMAALATQANQADPALMVMDQYLSVENRSSAASTSSVASSVASTVRSAGSEFLSVSNPSTRSLPV